MKIFKSVVNDKELMIRPSGNPDYMVLGIRDSHLHGRVEMIGISREDIPSITFAMAESAGWSDEVKPYSLSTPMVRQVYVNASPVYSPKERQQAFNIWLDKVKTEAKVEALKEAADDWHAENTGTSPRAYNWLLDRAEQV